ncbi:hypothetical protein INR77_00440 [Erythrobacter sp. SCSIO 43205]|uniref:hypothetical protein n=1 Tax=Erythrobacter sp. SCSIO 43205 TaxID=2779361 RepID=UPI001CA8DC92|nr:hypothetical protein [Erythrobacter sp. SCSIO 43205]UAB78261.1 hypothetical protein INR77_00440 [Erythrobacter sp. SCSIO 43205]
MSRKPDNQEAFDAHAGSFSWPVPARFIPAPATASQKAALAAKRVADKTVRPVRSRMSNKTRAGFGTAAVAVAVALPNLSLGAVAGSFAGPYFGGPEPLPEPISTPTFEVPRTLTSKVWSPDQQSAETIYAKAISVEEHAAPVTARTRLSDFDREMPVAVLASGSQEFDLAFAGVEMPTGFVAPPSLSRGAAPAPLVSKRKDTIRTPSVAIDQITDMGPVVKATPENAGEQGTTLSVGSAAARTEAISNRSVEAAFAGAIDASNAVRSALPIARTATAAQPVVRDAARAIPVAAPPPELRGAAAAETALVPKTKMDARVNGVLTGKVDFQQGRGTIAIRLRSVANVMREQFSKSEYDEILSGRSIDSFVPLAELQAAGIPINYNPAYDEVEFGIDYKDAPNAKKVQIDQISVAPVGPQLTAIEQIAR